MVPLSSVSFLSGVPSAATVKTICTVLAAALVLATAAAGAPAPTVDPAKAAVGARIVITGAPGDVELEPLDTAGPRYPLGRIEASGTVETVVPQVAPGRYRVIADGSGEAPVLEVVALSGETSAALLVFGALFLVAMLVGGVVVHRRWRDAVS